MVRCAMATAKFFRRTSRVSESSALPTGITAHGAGKPIAILRVRAPGLVVAVYTSEGPEHTPWRADAAERVPAGRRQDQRPGHHQRTDPEYGARPVRDGLQCSAALRLQPVSAPGRLLAAGGRVRLD